MDEIKSKELKKITQEYEKQKEDKLQQIKVLQSTLQTKKERKKQREDEITKLNKDIVKYTQIRDDLKKKAETSQSNLPDVDQYSTKAQVEEFGADWETLRAKENKLKEIIKKYEDLVGAIEDWRLR